MIKTAILSFGMSGEIFHAPLIDVHPGFALVSVLERKSERSAKKYPRAKIVRRIEDIANDPEVELVIVNTPNHTHFEFTKMMLDAGKHVVVEKPFTNTYSEAIGLIECAKQNNRLLTVFQNRRWDSDFLTVKKIVSKQLCGEPVEFEAHFDRFRPYIEPDTWKEEDLPGSGILYNLGSHLVDQALVLFGEPASVRGESGVQRKDGRAVDFYKIYMDYGLLQVILKSSYLVRELGPRFVLHGRKGSFVKYGTDPQEQALKEGRIPGQGDWGREKESDWGLLNTEINGLHFRGKIESFPGNYLAFYDNLFAAIRSGAELAVKPEEAARAIKIIEEI